jgi:hypothetical protein
MGKAKRLRAERKATDAAAKSSPYPANARSFELKMLRANSHLNDLKAIVETWIKAALKTYEEELDPDGSGYYLAWITPPAPDHSHMSLLVGDCLQCLRSTLDHLAFELAAAFTSPMTDEIEEDSEFPIVGDIDRKGQGRAGARKWQDGAVRKVRGTAPAAQTIIEGSQPYQRGNAFEDDPLWRLGALNNIDKHRALHVTGMAMKGAGFPVNGPALPRSEWSTNVKAIGPPEDRPSTIAIYSDIKAEGRTKVARWEMQPIDLSKPMHMNFKPMLDIAFDPATPLVGGESVSTTLAQLHNYILSDVITPLLGFLK